MNWRCTAASPRRHMGSPSVPGGCGAAAASLRDPACTPGTPQFNAAKKENEGILAVFRKYMVHHKANGVSL